MDPDTGLFHDVFSDHAQNFFQSGTVGMNVQVDGLGKIQAENAHDRFCVNDISSGNKIKITVKPADLVDKCFYFIDLIQRDFNGFHK